MSLNLVIHQLPSSLGDKNENIIRADTAIKKFRLKNPALHLFPELYVTGYSCGRSFRKLAETASGPAVSKITRSLDEGTLVLVGMPEKDPFENKVYNSALAINRFGIVAKYRKIYLPEFWVFREKEIFSRGDAPCVMDVKGVKIGLQICYDINFPELSRVEALRGAEMIVVVSATPKESIPRFKTLMKARAIENQCFMVYVNKVGVEDKIIFGGNSMVVAPDGEILLELDDKDASNVCKLDFKMVSEARSKIPLLKDAETTSFKELNQCF